MNKAFWRKVHSSYCKGTETVRVWTQAGKKVVEAIDTEKMSLLQKHMALKAINLIKGKSDGTLKRSTCADGSKQRQYLR